MPIALSPMRLLTKKLLWWLPTILLIALIMFLSGRSIPSLPGHLPDKVIHFLVYAVLASLFYLSLFHSDIQQKTVFWALVLTIVVGALDEYLQSFTIMRNSNVFDLLADGFGAVMGSVVTKRVNDFRVRSTG